MDGKKMKRNKKGGVRGSWIQAVGQSLAGFLAVLKHYNQDKRTFLSISCSLLNK